MSPAVRRTGARAGVALSARLWDAFQTVVGGNDQKQAVIKAQIPHAGRVLEIGCGTGNVAAVFADADYVGVDIDSGRIALAAEKFPQPNYRFYCMDVLDEDLPEPQSFDTVLVSHTAHHLSDAAMKRLLRRSAALLRRHGELVILDMLRPEPHEPFSKQFYFKLDRGAHIRNETELFSLFGAEEGFEEPRAEILKVHKFGVEVIDEIVIRARRRAHAEGA
jgi:SAM-dependent methyltransferase